MNQLSYEQPFHPGPFQQFGHSQTSMSPAPLGAGGPGGAGPGGAAYDHAQQPHAIAGAHPGHQQHLQHFQHQHQHQQPPSWNGAAAGQHLHQQQPQQQQQHHHHQQHMSLYSPASFAGTSPLAAQQQQQHRPYTGPPSASPLHPSPASTPFQPSRHSPGAQQQQQQHLHQAYAPGQQPRQSHFQSPIDGATPTPPPPQQQQLQQQQYPMAAPPLPQTPTIGTTQQQQQPQQASASAAASPKTPQSPATQSRVQRQVALLLEINVELLQEINNLQAQGKGGATHANQLNQPIPGQPDKKLDKMASEDYIQCLRRVQANLQILAPLHTGQKLQTPGPVHMLPPPHMPQLQARYDQLKELFPGWAGLDHKFAEKAASPAHNPSVANGASNTTAPSQA